MTRSAHIPVAVDCKECGTTWRTTYTAMEHRVVTFGRYVCPECRPDDSVPAERAVA